MKMVSLLDCGASGTRLGAFLEAVMRGFKPEEFMMVIGRLDYNLVLYEREKEWSEVRKHEFLKHWATLRELCARSGLHTTANSVQTIIDYIHSDETYLVAHLDESVRSARRTLYEEMKTLVYFEIPQDQIHLWANIEPFGPDVTNKFPNAANDIKEAARCLAVDRGTACVLHLARAMEHVLRAFGASLSAKFKPTDDWKDMLDEIDVLIKPLPTTTSTDMARKDVIRQAHADLGRVKLAWRLPAAHSRGEWTPEQAEDVFGSCKAFSRNVAKVI